MSWIDGLTTSHLSSLANWQPTAIPYVEPPKSASEADISSTDPFTQVPVDTIGKEIDKDTR